ncbi:MAG: DUF6261 family protein [Microscillaceae bacterium]|nr:DUF6261 family protein [Microscillaceae bacterium]
MLSTPDFRFFRNGEFIKFISNVLIISSRQDVAGLQIDKQVADLQQVHEVLIRFYKTERGNKLTQDIVDLDKQRDDAYMGLRGITFFYARYHHDESLRNQANSLLKVLDKHGSEVAKKSYQEQGAALDDIIQIIEASPELLKTLDTLRLTDWFTRMKSSHQAFDEKFLARNKVYAESPKEKFKSLREQSTQAYRELARFITAYATIGNAENYQDYINQLNQLVNSYNLTINNRKANQQEAEKLDEDFNLVKEE